MNNRLFSPFFGEFGGQFVPEILIPALQALTEAFENAINDADFQTELNQLLMHYAGRPTPLYECQSFGRTRGNRVFLKREDLLHGGAHKTNQVLAQALLAKRLGKQRIIAETGAGQHGVAVAMVAAKLKLKAHIYMGQLDYERQYANVQRMKLLGATVSAVGGDSGTLKEAVNEALRDWAGSYAVAHYLLGTAAGPHPYPVMVREFQKVIGIEARAQIQERIGRLPDVCVACVGGGSNAIGLFHAFLNDDVALVGVEAGGLGVATGRHGATICAGQIGILHGARTMVMSDADGQIQPSHSISAGLDYPAVGPEHVHLAATGRADYVSVTDQEALRGFCSLSQQEGIIPALESSHALAWVEQQCQQQENKIFLVNLSGRGDKDLTQVFTLLEPKSNESPIFSAI